MVLLANTSCLPGWFKTTSSYSQTFIALHFQMMKILFVQYNAWLCEKLFQFWRRDNEWNDRKGTKWLKEMLQTRRMLHHDWRFDFIVCFEHRRIRNMSVDSIKFWKFLNMQRKKNWTNLQNHKWCKIHMENIWFCIKFYFH